MVMVAVAHVQIRSAKETFMSASHKAIVFGLVKGFKLTAAVDVANSPVNNKIIRKIIFVVTFFLVKLLE